MLRLGVLTLGEKIPIEAVLLKWVIVGLRLPKRPAKATNPTPVHPRENERLKGEWFSENNDIKFPSFFDAESKSFIGFPSTDTSIFLMFLIIEIMFFTTYSKI